MRVDFYQLEGICAGEAVAAIAAKAWQGNWRMLVVAVDAEELKRIGASLWARGDAFLANGHAGQAHAARQPILLSPRCEAENGARLVILADGQWRDEALAFDRAALLFTAEGREDARIAWRGLGMREGVDRRYWKRSAGKWVEGP